MQRRNSILWVTLAVVAMAAPVKSSGSVASEVLRETWAGWNELNLTQATIGFGPSSVFRVSNGDVVEFLNTSVMTSQWKSGMAMSTSCTSHSTDVIFSPDAVATKTLLAYTVKDSMVSPQNPWHQSQEYMITATVDPTTRKFTSWFELYHNPSQANFTRMKAWGHKWWSVWDSFDTEEVGKLLVESAVGFEYLSDSTSPGPNVYNKTALLNTLKQHRTSLSKCFSQVQETIVAANAIAIRAVVFCDGLTVPSITWRTWSVFELTKDYQLATWHNYVDNR